jgi:hypothetical protein
MTKQRTVSSSQTALKYGPDKSLQLNSDWYAAATESRRAYRKPMTLNPSKRSALVLAYYYPPQNTSGAARPSRFVKYLREIGFTMHVISAGMGSDAVLVDGEAVHSDAMWLKMASSAGRVYHRLFRAYGDRMPWVPYATNAASNVLSRQPVDFVISTSPPLATHLVAMRLKQKFPIRWIADFRDPLAGNPFGPKRQNHRNVLERKLFERADLILSTTDVLQSTWAEQYPQFQHKFHTIWNGFDPEERVEAIPSHGEGPRILAHVGEIYGARNPRMIVESLDRLFHSGRIGLNDIRLCLVGPLDENSSLRSDAAFLRLRDIGLVECREGLVDRSQALAITKKADQLLLLDVSDVDASLQLPAKLFDYLRVQRPVVAQTTKGSPSDRILAKSGVPHECIYRGDPPDVVDEKCLRALKLPRATNPANEWFWSQFDGRRQVHQLAALLGNFHHGCSD